MHFREVGLTGMKWTPIGLGTWNMETDAKSAVHAIQAGLDAGANHIDTAEMYGGGRVEEIVGEALRGRRDKVFLVSKVLPSNAGFDATIKACERSLSRLNSDHLDVYLLHWRGRTPLEETIRAFETLKRDGKIRHWGVSNFDVRDMEEAAKIGGEKNIACNQVLYHLEERSIEAKLIPWCDAHQIPVVAYSPLGQGRTPNHPALDAVAKSHRATAAQVALAFLIRDSNVFAIPKSSNGNRVKENVKAADITLTQAEYNNIDNAFPMKPRRGLPTL